MDPVNVYGSYPDHLDIEKEAVQRSTQYFPNVGLMCLKTQLNEYDRCMILDVRDDWLLIKVINQLEYKSGGIYPLIGLIRKEDMKKLPQKSVKELGKPFSEIIHTAQAYIGIPYRWGGKSKNATDCSGLICQIYQEHGINLPRYADGQFYFTKEINPEDLQPGDLIFIVVGKPVHVMIYLNNQRMIESCGLPEIFTTRIITFKEKWGIYIDDLFNGITIAGGQIYFHRFIK